MLPDGVWPLKQPRNWGQLMFGYPVTFAKFRSGHVTQSGQWDRKGFLLFFALDVVMSKCAAWGHSSQLAHSRGWSQHEGWQSKDKTLHILVALLGYWIKYSWSLLYLGTSFFGEIKNSFLNLNQIELASQSIVINRTCTRRFEVRWWNLFSHLLEHFGMQK